MPLKASIGMSGSFSNYKSSVSFLFALLCLFVLGVSFAVPLLVLVQAQIERLGLSTHRFSRGPLLGGRLFFSSNFLPRTN